MAKYKLTVKYSGVCELSIAGDIPDIIRSEFDQYVKSILYKKEEWENFETNFKEAAKLEYGDPKKLEDLAKEAEESQAEETAGEAPEKTNKEDTENNQENMTLNENSPKDDIKENTEAEETPKSEEENSEEEKTEEQKPEEEKPAKKAKKSRMELISFSEYVKNKNINTPLDEFVAGACYLDEILNVKEFNLKQINAKLYPVFKRLASSIVIDEATERVLIETIKEDDKVRYKINQNAWNYHNFDLVGRK